MTLDLQSGAATVVGTVPLGSGSAGGLAFDPLGNLYLTTVSPIAGFGTLQQPNPMDFVQLDPNDGSVVSRVDLLLEQQVNVTGGGLTRLIRSAPLQGLVVLPEGLFLGTGDNGITVVYERVFAPVLDPSGTPIGDPTWVWRVAGDGGENLADLAFVPEPATGLLVGLGLAGFALLRRFS